MARPELIHRTARLAAGSDRAKLARVVMPSGFTAIQVEPFFALKYQRLLFRSGDAALMGPASYAICSFVASIQDERRFQSPCVFFNGFLMEMLGISKVHTLIAARKRAIDLGWLGFTSGKKSREACQYWICVPERICNDELLPKNGTSNGTSLGSSNGSSHGSSVGTREGSRSGIDCGIPITLDPMPNPEPEPEKKGVSAKTPKSKKGPILVDELALPDWANNHACKTAIDKFLNYRKDIGKPYKSPGHLLEQISRFERFGAEAFIASVSETVASGSWQGLFLPKTNGRGLFDKVLPPAADRVPTKDDDEEINRIGLQAFAEKYNLK